MSSGPSSRIRRSMCLAASGLAIALSLTLMWRLLIERNPDTKVIPELVRILDVGSLVLLAIGVFLAACALTRALRSPMRWAAALAATLSIASLAAYHYESFDIFSDRLVGTSRSPDGHSVAYLYHTGLFSLYVLYEREGYGLTMQDRSGRRRACGSLEVPRIAWDERGEPYLVGTVREPPLVLYPGPDVRLDDPCQGRMPTAASDASSAPH